VLHTHVFFLQYYSAFINEVPSLGTVVLVFVSAELGEKRMQLEMEDMEVKEDISLETGGGAIGMPRLYASC
jgi:hypothetical protein